MKIAFFTDAYLDLNGGIVSSMNAQKHALEELGHTVYIFSTGFHRPERELAALMNDHIYIVPSCRLFFLGIAPISRRPRVIEKWLMKNFPELKEFDVFHIHYEGGCSIAGIRLGRKLKIPVVQTMHGREDMGETSIIPFGLRSFVAFHLNWFHSWYMPHETKVKRDKYLATSYARAKMWTLMVNHANAADTVITPSKHFKDKLTHYGVTRDIDVVSNGIDDDLVPARVSARRIMANEPLKIVWNSRFSPEKRAMKFLEALKMVDFPYVMEAFGSGTDIILGKNYVKLNRLKVNFHGDTKREEILRTMKESHLGVLASYGFDNQPMTMLEAEVTGLPILICDPDMLEVTTKNGVYLADGPEPKDLAKALTDIYNDPEKIVRMSVAMIKDRNQAKQSHQIKKLLSIYERVKK